MNTQPRTRIFDIILDICSYRNGHLLRDFEPSCLRSSQGFGRGSFQFRVNVDCSCRLWCSGSYLGFRSVARLVRYFATGCIGISGCLSRGHIALLVVGAHRTCPSIAVEHDHCAFCVGSWIYCFGAGRERTLPCSALPSFSGGLILAWYLHYHRREACLSLRPSCLTGRIWLRRHLFGCWPDRSVCCYLWSCLRKGKRRLERFSIILESPIGDQ